MAIGVGTAVDDVDPFLLHVSYLTYFGELYRELRRVYEEPNPPRVSLAKHSVVITLTLPEATDVPSREGGGGGRGKGNNSCFLFLRVRCASSATEVRVKLLPPCCQLCKHIARARAWWQYPWGRDVTRSMCFILSSLTAHEAGCVFAAARYITVEHLLPASTGLSASCWPCIIIMILALYCR